MNKRDTAMVMAVLQTAYPSYYAKRSEQQMREALSLWAEMFADDPAELVGAAVKTIIVASDNPFPPSIGEIKAKMRDLTTQDDMTETEAWAMVSKACKNGIYGYKKEFEALPEAVQIAVGRPEQLREWALMDEDTVGSVVASNFMRGYRAAKQRVKEREMLPPSVRAMLAQTGLIQITDGGDHNG